MPIIHRFAEIHPSAKLADDVEVGPWTVIGPHVEIEAGTWVGPHVIINGPTRIGKNNKIFQFASIGEDPQDKTYAGEPTELIIGDHNVIREYCTLSRGTVKGGGITQIGNHNFLMAYVHVGHDCRIENHTIFTNYSALSGHVVVESYAILSGYSAIHQFCTVGQHSFVAKATYATKDILPYVMVAGQNPSACGINVEGLKRRGFTTASIEGLRRAYKVIFRRGLTVQQAIEELVTMAVDCLEIQCFIDALKRTTRGIVR